MENMTIKNDNKGVKEKLEEAIQVKLLYAIRVCCL